MKVGTLAIVLVCAPASAQVVPGDARVILDFDGPSVVTPENPTVTARAWAAWDPPDNRVLLLVRLDLRTSEPGLENPVIHMHPSSTWGAPGPFVYTRATFSQVHLPPLGIFGNPDNPILLGTIDWRATQFTPRKVALSTENEMDFRVSEANKYIHLEPVASGDLPCYADCDNSANLDIFDFLCFQDAFIQADPYADCDGSNAFDIFDFVCFQDAFVTGCP